MPQWVVLERILKGSLGSPEPEPTPEPVPVPEPRTRTRNPKPETETETETEPEPEPGTTSLPSSSWRSSGYLASARTTSS